MRANVIDYYDKFLDPDRFLDRLLTHPARERTLFMEDPANWQSSGEYGGDVRAIPPPAGSSFSNSKAR